MFGSSTSQTFRHFKLECITSHQKALRRSTPCYTIPRLRRFVDLALDEVSSAGLVQMMLSARQISELWLHGLLLVVILAESCDQFWWFLFD
jgi:hypothetical protein